MTGYCEISPSICCLTLSNHVDYYSLSVCLILITHVLYQEDRGEDLNDVLFVFHFVQKQFSNPAKNVCQR